MKKIIDLIDQLAEKTGGAVSWLVALLTVVTVYDVIARYVFRAGSVALQEMEWHIFALIFLLSAGYTLKKDGHVRVDLFYSKLSKRGKAIVDIAGTILLLLPFSILVIYTSSKFTITSFNMGEGSGDPGGLPARYILKGSIVLGFALLLLQGIAEILRNSMVLLGKDKK